MPALPLVGAAEPQQLFGRGEDFAFVHLLRAVAADSAELVVRAAEGLRHVPTEPRSSGICQPDCHVVLGMGDQDRAADALFR